MLIGKHSFVIFLSIFVRRNFTVTCSSIEMLKGYMARESLGAPDLEYSTILMNIKYFQHTCI